MKLLPLFDRVIGSLLLASGTALVTPEIGILISHLFVYTVAWSPVWTPQLAAIMAVFGVVNITAGARLNWYGSREDGR